MRLVITALLINMLAVQFHFNRLGKKHGFSQLHLKDVVNGEAASLVYSPY